MQGLPVINCKQWTRSMNPIPQRWEKYVQIPLDAVKIVAGSRAYVQKYVVKGLQDPIIWSSHFNLEEDNIESSCSIKNPLYKSSPCWGLHLLFRTTTNRTLAWITATHHCQHMFLIPIPGQYSVKKPYKTVTDIKIWKTTTKYQHHLCKMCRMDMCIYISIYIYISL